MKCLEQCLTQSNRWLLAVWPDAEKDPTSVLTEEPPLAGLPWGHGGHRQPWPGKTSPHLRSFSWVWTERRGFETEVQEWGWVLSYRSTGRSGPVWLLGAGRGSAAAGGQTRARVQALGSWYRTPKLGTPCGVCEPQRKGGGMPILLHVAQRKAEYFTVYVTLPQCWYS